MIGAHVLTNWLRQPLEIAEVKRALFPRGPATEEEIVVTNRLVLVLSGELDYTVEGARTRMKAGTQFLVPAWVRRVWSVPHKDSCEIIWCTFDDEEADRAFGACVPRPLGARELTVERTAYLRMFDLHAMASRSPEKAAACRLGLEAELKGMLGRFVLAARLPKPLSEDVLPHPKIRAALRWLGQHFQEPDALEGLYHTCAMSRDYFRSLFSATMECSPQDYIQRLRLRKARYLLLHTEMTVKEITFAVGYEDPLYFSRLYHRFWDVSPSAERRR